MSPFSYSRTKTSRTARDRPGSSVKRSRDQSQEAPRRIIWLLMVSPYCSFHAQTRFSNSSRPRSRRLIPSSASLRSTTICVAIPAWSVPGSHNVLSPRMRCHRVVTSISVCSSMCPMCSDPVTLGGGMTSENTGPGLLLEARKMPESIHHCAQCGSNRNGSYTLSICMGRIYFSRANKVGQALSPANPLPVNPQKPVHKILVTLFALFSVPCIRISPGRTHLHATFELGKELRSSQSFESTSPAGKRCFLDGTETSGGLTALRNPPGVFPMGPSTEETWNRLHNPETWLMLRRK